MILEYKGSYENDFPCFLLMIFIFLTVLNSNAYSYYYISKTTKKKSC